MVTSQCVFWLLVLCVRQETDASEFKIFEEARLANTPQCPDPVPVANAYRWSSADGSVDYECLLGYRMKKGDGSLACLENGTWSGQPPTCELTCGQPPISLGANMTGLLTDGSGVTYALYRCLPSVNSTYTVTDMFPCIKDAGYWTTPATNCIYPNGFHTNLTSLVYSQSAYNTTWAHSSLRTTASLGAIEDLDLTCLRLDVSGANATNFTEIEVSVNNITRLFEFLYIELSLETVDTDTECVEASSNSTSLVYGVNYTGIVNVTASGLPCLPWQDVAASNQTYVNLTSTSFPDANLSDASNYCRNPLRSGAYRERPWCFTLNSSFVWEYCSIRQCSRFTVMVKVTSTNTSSQTCGQSSFYRAQADKKIRITCPKSPTAPFGTNLRITVNSTLTRSLYICDVVGHGVDYENMCGEPRHQRGWNLTTPLSYHEGAEAVYTCAKGYHHIQGDGVIKCLATRVWSPPTLVCSGEPNHAYTNRTTPEPIQDNDINTCAMPSAGRAVDVILDYTVEVRQVAVVFAGVRPNNVTVTADCLGKFNRACRGMIETIYGYLFTCTAYPITERIVIAYDGPDENTTLCEVKVFGRKYTGVLECRQTESGVDYKGHQAISRDGHVCAMWASFNKSEFLDYEFPDGNIGDTKNYCRNPIKKSTGTPQNTYRPLCYYRKPNFSGWDYCDLFLCDRGCRTSNAGLDYIGKIDQALKNGTTSVPCAVWNSGSSNFKLRADFPDYGSPSTRYCRNPGESQERPWCYTNTTTMAYSYCDVPMCPTTDNTDLVNLDLNSTTDQMMLKNYTDRFRECLLTEFFPASYGPPIYDAIMYQLCYTNPGKHRDLLCHYKSASGDSKYGDNSSWTRVNIVCPPYSPTTTTTAANVTISTTRASTLVHTTTHAMMSTTDNETSSQNVCPLTCTVRCVHITNYSIEIKVYQEKIRQELLVNTITLSKTVRLKSSAPDARPSARVTGGVAIAVMVVIVVFLLSGDAISLSIYVYLKIKGRPFKL